MIPIYFIDFKAGGEDAKFILSMLVAAVHGFNATADKAERIGMCFPSMQAATVNVLGRQELPATSGEVLRVFGSEKNLETFATSRIPGKLLRRGAVTKTTIEHVPEGAGEIRVVRDRQFEKGFKGGSYARRQMKRAELQGRPYIARARRSDDSCGFGFHAMSKSSNRAFVLDVRSEIAESCAVLGDITAYGLCGPGSSVPWF